MANTPNYNLKKPDYTEMADIPGHFNGNMDTIDTTLKAHEDELATKETPTGAQAKADAAESNAKNHANGLIGSLANLLTTAKTNLVAAINELKTNHDAHLADSAAHGIDKIGQFITGSLSSVQSIANDSLTQIQLSGINNDYYIFSSGKIQVLEAGIYAVQARVKFFESANGIREVCINSQPHNTNANAGGTTELELMYVFQLGAGATIELAVRQTSGASLSVYGGATQVRVVKIK